MLAGHVVASLAKNLVTTAIVFGLALLMGFRPTASPLEWLAAVGVILLFVHWITWLATLVGVLVRSPDAAGGFAFFVMFLPVAALTWCVALAVVFAVAAGLSFRARR